MDSDKGENIKKIIKFGIQFYISLKLFSIGTDFIGTFLRTINVLTEKSALIPILSDVLLLLIILAFYLLYKYMKKKNTDEWYND